MRVDASEIHRKLRGDLTRDERHEGIAIILKRMDGTFDGTPTKLSIHDALHLITSLAGAIGRARVALVDDEVQA